MKAHEILHSYRYAFVALAISIAVHASVIVGVPGQLAKVPEVDAAKYLVELAPLPEVSVTVPGLVASPPPPRPPRPRSPRKPTETIASLPPIAVGSASAADSLPQLAEAIAPLAPPEPSEMREPRKAVDEARPELLAAAVPATPIPALDPAPEFPTNALPERLRIRYQLTSPFADGRAEYSWRREGDQYEINGSAEAVGFFTLFLEGRILQESSGSITALGLKPDRFVERKPQGPEEGLVFDWANKRMEFHRNDEVKPGALTDNTVDWLSMIFQLAHVPPKGESLEMKVYTQRKLYEFSLKVLGVEELKLPIGTVSALHLRHATDDPKETVDVWLGIDQHYLPVKLRYPVARNRFMVEQIATSISAR